MRFVAYVWIKVAAFLIFFGMAACAPTESGTANRAQPPTEKAVAYRLLAVEDTSFPGRTRKAARIYAPEAVKVGERAETALKAAVDLQQKWGADAVGVFLLVSTNRSLQQRGYPLAIANYSPDGGGWSGENPFRNITWEVEATDIALSEQEIQIAELWYENADKFKIDDGNGGQMTDEKALQNYIAEKLKIDRTKVTLLPFMSIITTRKPYLHDK